MTQSILRWWGFKCVIMKAHAFIKSRSFIIQRKAMMIYWYLSDCGYLIKSFKKLIGLYMISLCNKQNSYRGKPFNTSFCFLNGNQITHKQNDSKQFLLPIIKYSQIKTFEPFVTDIYCLCWNFKLWPLIYKSSEHMSINIASRCGTCLNPRYINCLLRYNFFS